ncbi:MAG: phage antirepressor KilAC domain-containing protein [Bacteroides sp.]|nr:phage antirepressor KilAC domain-containing protein [Bacteroides sp.]
MTNGMTIFKSNEFGTIRTMRDAKGEPLFCAKDVCNALGYDQARKAIQRHVDKEDGTKHTLLTNGGKQQAIFINESGLYALILSSKLDSAKRFKHWVTGEVLPCIRKQGGYMVVRPEESNEVILARALQIMQTMLQRRDEQIADLKPRANYADEVLDSISCFTVTQIGKELNMTGHDLNRILCEMRIQYVQSGQYLLYADYARQGLAKNRTFEYHTSNGDLVTKTYLVWTERGRDFIHRLLNKSLAN